MSEPTDKLQTIFDAALRDLLVHDRKPILDHISERSICGCLACHLRAASLNAGYEGYFVDVEYNRNRGKVKTYLDNELLPIPMTCDLILHSRGEIPRRDNLLAVELKKSGARIAHFDADRRRLRAMTKVVDEVWQLPGGPHPSYVCGYELGLLVTIDARWQRVSIERFVLGESAGRLDRSFREILGDAA